MINPYEIDKDPQFRKFFKHLLTPDEIMKSDDIPCDNAHLEKLELAKRACQGDIELIIEAIAQQITDDDVNALFTNPRAFGQSMRNKVLAYIESVVDGESNNGK